MRNGGKSRNMAVKRPRDSFDSDKSAEVFGALSDPTRLRILLMLEREPLSVRDVASRLQLCPADVLKYVVMMESAGTVSLADVQERSPRYTAQGVGASH